MTFAAFRSFFRDKITMLQNDKFLCIYHAGSAISWIGASQTDMFELRSASMLGSCTSLAYLFTRPTGPNYQAAFWAVSFLYINTTKWWDLFKDRQEVTLYKNEENTYKEHFESSKMRPAQFKKLIGKAKIEYFEPGYSFTKYGEKNQGKVWLLISGDAKVSISGEEIATISSTQKSCFIGELDLLKSDLAQKSENSSEANLKDDHRDRATCTAVTDIIAYEWDQAYLKDILRHDNDLSDRLHNVLLATILFKFENNLINTHKHTYFALLGIFTQEGKIDIEAKKVFDSYRATHKIDDKFHEHCLQSVHWTKDDWYAGRRLSDVSPHKDESTTLISKLQEKLSKTSDNFHKMYDILYSTIGANPFSKGKNLKKNE